SFFSVLGVNLSMPSFNSSSLCVRTYHAPPACAPRSAHLPQAMPELSEAGRKLMSLERSRMRPFPGDPICGPGFTVTRGKSVDGAGVAGAIGYWLYGAPCPG